ncbi:MAG TPA: Fe3+ hydroxamate ABC transporter substrate-binding protein [Pseudogracilibacillus sp.]|nr:Fe3+ hydroxamate ABC transporter substrate-binding protein [Pseudogracilibacillus sp.]
MLWDDPTCMFCEKKIEKDEPIYVKMHYPKRKGFTEITAYLRNEARFICEACYGK